MTENKIAILCLASKDYLKWVNVQVYSLTKLRTSGIDYVLVTEGEIWEDKYSTRYDDVAQLLYANRPKQVLKLFEQGYETVIFVGADIYFTGHFIPSDYKQYDALFVPHTIKPLPNDGHAPSNLGMLRTGNLNSDFTIWNKTEAVIEFLEWQAEQMELYECVAKLDMGLFFDQGWLQAAISFLPNICIIQSTAYNVAYYNLHCRELKKAGVKWFVDGKSMAFFQFSGYKPDEAPYNLSKYNTRPQIQTAAVAQLMQEFLSIYKEATDAGV